MKVLMPVTPRQDGLDLNNDGRVTIDELAHSALLVFLALVVFLAAILGGGWVLLFSGAAPLWRVVSGSISLAAIITACLLFRRMTRFERMEKEAKIDKEFERKKAKWEFDQARGVSAEAGATTMTQAQIDAAVYHILSRYYAGREWSREACEKDGAITAEVWNEANRLLKTRRIRSGRKTELTPATFAEAWGIYCEAKLQANRHKMDGRGDPDWREAS